jgi:hypothetical protein
MLEIKAQISVDLAHRAMLGDLNIMIAILPWLFNSFQSARGSSDAHLPASARITAGLAFEWNVSRPCDSKNLEW